MVTEKNNKGSGKSTSQLWNRQADDLLRAVLQLRTVPEARRFIRDLMTEDEIRMIVTRWQVAEALHAGKTYRQIEEELGLSSRTIARISHWLRDGEGGYRLMLHRHNHTEKK
ncbi:MAG: YerC/YecD family TrpR-related protein [Phycisphaerae bacterium]